MRSPQRCSRPALLLSLMAALAHAAPRGELSSRCGALRSHEGLPRCLHCTLRADGDAPLPCRLHAAPGAACTGVSCAQRPIPELSLDSPAAIVSLELPSPDGDERKRSQYRVIYKTEVRVGSGWDAWPLDGRVLSGEGGRAGVQRLPRSPLLPPALALVQVHVNELPEHFIYSLGSYVPHESNETLAVFKHGGVQLCGGRGGRQRGVRSPIADCKGAALSSQPHHTGAEPYLKFRDCPGPSRSTVEYACSEAVPAGQERLVHVGEPQAGSCHYRLRVETARVWCARVGAGAQPARLCTGLPD